jgi:hypothetical protein
MAYPLSNVSIYLLNMRFGNAKKWSTHFFGGQESRIPRAALFEGI